MEKYKSFNYTLINFNSKNIVNDEDNLVKYQYYMNLEKDKLVVFIDILGFSVKVLANEKTQLSDSGTMIINFESVFEIINSYNTSAKINENSRFKFLWVSDSLIFTSDINNFDIVLNEVSKLINSFYCYGLAVRGAITLGSLYHETNIWGPAFIKAVEDEKKAKFPRIIIKKEVLKLVPEVSEFRNYFKASDIADYYYYDYFNWLFSKNILQKKSITSVLKIYSKMISNNIRENIELEKYNWLREEMMRNLDEKRFEIIEICKPEILSLILTDLEDCIKE